MRSRRASSFARRAVGRVVGSWWNTSPDIESLGSRAVVSIGRHSDETHAAALELINELVAVGREPVTSALGPWLRGLRLSSAQI